jgi:hypothetical protein
MRFSARYLHIVGSRKPRAKRTKVASALFAFGTIPVQGAGNLTIPICWKGKENNENGMSFSCLEMAAENWK